MYNSNLNESSDDNNHDNNIIERKMWINKMYETDVKISIET